MHSFYFFQEIFISSIKSFFENIPRIFFIDVFIYRSNNRFYTSVIRLLFNFYLIFLPLHFLHHYRSTNRFCTAERAKEIEEFFEKNPLPSSQRRISQSVEVMRYVRTCVYLCVCVRGGDSVCVHKCMYAFIHTVWALYVLYSIILHHCV